MEVVEDYNFHNIDRLEVLRHLKSDTTNGNLPMAISVSPIISRLFLCGHAVSGRRDSLDQQPLALSLQPCMADRRHENEQLRVVHRAKFGLCNPFRSAVSNNCCNVDHKPAVCASGFCRVNATRFVSLSDWSAGH